MTTEALLSQLVGRGVHLAVRDDQLQIDAPKGALTPDLRQALAERKTGLLGLLIHSGAGQRPGGEASIPSISAATLQQDTQARMDEPTANCNLASYFMDVLAASPQARQVRDRQGLAGYLARAIRHRYSLLEGQPWSSGRPLLAEKPLNRFLTAVCPAGHLTDEVLGDTEVLGWACEVCQKVYDATECRLLVWPCIGGFGHHRLQAGEPGRPW